MNFSKPTWKQSIVRSNMLSISIRKSELFSSICTMPSNIFLLVLVFSLTVSCIHVQSDEEGYITAEISNKGLDFIKDALVQEAESSLVPMVLPKIEKIVKIPVLGNVRTVLSNITIEEIHVISSTLRTEDDGIVIDVSGATANLSLNWKYEYITWLLPISVSDKGSARVQVDGLEVALILSLKTQNGSLKLSTSRCGCHVNDISINLDGGASWLYQGLIDAFVEKIASAVEEAIPKKLKEAAVKLDSLLQSLPKEVALTTVASLNVTFVDDPKLSDVSLDLVIDGLFSAKEEDFFRSLYLRLVQSSVSCNESDKMLKISLHKDVLQSLSLVYFEANKMQWMVNKVPDQSLLNTAGWRFIIPQLYRKYPNHDMNLNLTATAPPLVEVENQQIKAVVPLDVVVNVLDEHEVIPVLCIFMEISSSVFVEISGNSVAGIVKLNDFSISLKWSDIGNLHMHLIQTLVSTTLRTVLLPYLNLKLSKGRHLPTFHGYTLQDARISCADSWIAMCSDVSSV